MSFDLYSVDEIRKKYGDVVELLTIEEVLKNKGGLSKGLVTEKEEGKYQIGNVFDSEMRIHASEP